MAYVLHPHAHQLGTPPLSFSSMGITTVMVCVLHAHTHQSASLPSLAWHTCCFHLVELPLNSAPQSLYLSRDLYSKFYAMALPPTPLCPLPLAFWYCHHPFLHPDLLSPFCDEIKSYLSSMQMVLLYFASWNCFCCPCIFRFFASHLLVLFRLFSPSVVLQFHFFY